MNQAVAQFAPLVLIMVVFYFLIMRPQQKKFKAHQAMLAALKVGDKVVLAAGFKGKVTRSWRTVFYRGYRTGYKNRGRSRTQCDCRKSRLICADKPHLESPNAALCFEFQPKA